MTKNEIVNRLAALSKSATMADRMALAVAVTKWAGLK